MVDRSENNGTTNEARGFDPYMLLNASFEIAVVALSTAIPLSLFGLVDGKTASVVTIGAFTYVVLFLSLFTLLGALIPDK